jgi:hypothetical protein
MSEEQESWTIVPAGSGQTAVVVRIAPGLSRPDAYNVTSAVYPVCAWRVSRDGDRAEPVLPENPDGAWVLISLPGGKLLRRGDKVYDSLDIAKSSANRGVGGFVSGQFIHRNAHLRSA